MFNISDTLAARRDAVRLFAAGAFYRVLGRAPVRRLGAAATATQVPPRFGLMAALRHMVTVCSRRRPWHALLAACLCAGLGFGAARAEQPLLITPLSETIVTALPTGELFWRIEVFDTLAHAQAAAGMWSLVTQTAGKIWSFSLGAPGTAAPTGARRIAEVGPIPRLSAHRYLLRINEAQGPPGGVTSVHSHPGSEAFLVLEGEQSIRSAHGLMRIKAGETLPGHNADEAMQVSSSGTTDLRALVMFLVDADKPFSVPATLP